MYGLNLPPGVTESMIPGNRPEDHRNERLVEDYDNADGYLEYVQEADRGGVADLFEEYCAEHFFNTLKDKFEALLHPDVKLDPVDPLADHWEEWGLFLWVVLDRERLDVLIEDFIETDRDAFEQWIVDHKQEDGPDEDLFRDR